MIGRLIIALAVASLPAASSAGQAEICYSAPVHYTLHQPPTNATVFACPVAGSHTLPELAALGWEVVQLTPIAINFTPDPAQSETVDQLVIQKR